MGVLARRFLNLIVSGRSPGVKLLRRIDLTRTQLFFYRDDDGSENPTSAAGRSSAMEQNLTMETIRFPARPSSTFRALNNQWKMACFPLADYSECRLICADQSGRGFGFDLDSATVETIPTLRPSTVVMMMPISVFVHKPHVDGCSWSHSMGSGLFLMEKLLRPESNCSQQASEQFMGFINRPSKSWHWHLLPAPPFVRRTFHWSNNSLLPQIMAYGVLGGGSHVCISVEGVGTYCLGTETLTWNMVGDWNLPFHGKVEYVPQLKLWLGLSADDAQELAAADLSGVLDPSSSSQPTNKLVGGPWKELGRLPEGWEECRDPQFVSLGSGRFCIARFFFSKEAQATTSFGGDQVMHKNFTVLTGVEVSRSTSGKNGTGKVELQMTPHRSIRVNNISIETLF